MSKRKKSKKQKNKKQQNSSQNTSALPAAILKSNPAQKPDSSKTHSGIISKGKTDVMEAETKQNVKETIMLPADNSSIAPIKKKRNIIIRIFKTLFKIFIFCGILILLSLLAVVYIFGRDLPDVRGLKEMNFEQTTHLYDRNGKELYSIFTNKNGEYINREYVSLKDINPYLIEGTIAIEDKKFYHHFGFDPAGIVRAQLKNFQNENISQGASTITQQLARNIYLSAERTYQRKIKELLLSVEMEWIFTKDQILELYFNKISYGANAYGVEAAAKTYFGKSVKDISLLEASILASLPKTPSYYSPYGSHVNELIGYCKNEETESPATQNSEAEKSVVDIDTTLDLKIKAHAPISIQVIHDGKKENFTLQNDEEKIFSDASKLQVYFGNNKVDAFLNDRKISQITAGKNITYDLNNWTSLVEKEVPSEPDAIVQTQSNCTSPEDPNYIFGRKDYVLQRMMEDNYITREQMLEAWKQGFSLKFVDPSFKIEAPHFVFYVKDFLEQKYGKELVESGGLQVTTSLDLNLQKIAEKAIANHVDKNQKSYSANNAGFVALDPKTGEILAMVGSRDYWDDSIDGKVNVTTSLRQPGSSFKPLVYAAAIQNAGIGSGTSLGDYKTIFNKHDIPKNYDGKYLGRMTIRQAIGGSRNIPAIKAYYVAGEEEKVLDFADKIGLTSLRSFRDNFNKTAAERGWTFYYGWPMAIGSGEVKLLDLVGAYSIFANQGKFAVPHPILEVCDRNGNLLDKFDGFNEAEQVMDPQVAFIMSDILSDIFVRPAGSWRALLTIPGHNVAAKTGTSNKVIRGALLPNNDLTIGFTPSLAAGAWVGNTDGTNMKSSAYSLYTSDPIYHDFFVEALKDKPSEIFPEPEGLKWVGKEIYPSWGGQKDYEKMFKRLDEPPKDVPLSNFLKNTSQDIKAAQNTAAAPDGIPQPIQQTTPAPNPVVPPTSTPIVPEAPAPSPQTIIVPPLIN